MIMLLVGLLVGVMLTFVVQVYMAERAIKERKNQMGRRFEAITRGKH